MQPSQYVYWSIFWNKPHHWHWKTSHWPAAREDHEQTCNWPLWCKCPAQRICKDVSWVSATRLHSSVFGKVAPLYPTKVLQPTWKLCWSTKSFVATYFKNALFILILYACLPPLDHWIFQSGQGVKPTNLAQPADMILPKRLQVFLGMSIIAVISI